MRHVLMNAALAISAFSATVASAGDVNIDVAITGEIAPGVYGRIDLGGRPPPPLVYAAPVIVEPPPAYVVAEPPIYLHVPPGHAKNWRKHCHEYHACNRQVYFVKSAEYEPGYVREKEHGYERHEHGEHRDHERSEHEHGDHEHGDHEHGDHEHGDRDHGDHD